MSESSPNLPSGAVPQSELPPPPRGPAPSIPVTLEEAALDSPTFRVSVFHFGEQVDAVERWLDGYMRAASRLVQDMRALEDAINKFLAKTVPTSPAAEAVIDNDYTLLALRRLGEASRDWWVQTLSTVRRCDVSITEPIRAFLDSDVRSFLVARRAFDQAQKTFDTALARYVSQSKMKEPSALREDAFALFENRKAYMRASLDLCVLGPQLCFSLDKLLVRMSSDMFRDLKRMMGAQLEMERIRGWAKEMEAFEYIFRRELLLSRKAILDASVSAQKPSRELEDYSPSPVESKGPANMLQKSIATAEKQGWLFFKSMSGKPVRTTWVRRWYYCRNGVFGWLVQDPMGVLQGDEIGVLLCNAKLAAQEERRFCFEVKTKMQNILLQAETQAQLAEWLDTFEAAKKRAFEASLSENGPGENDPAFSITPPSIPEFSARLLDIQPDDSGPAMPFGTIPGPDIASRTSFDVNSTISRRALTNLAREEGETGREHAARIMHRLDLHRKTNPPNSGELAPLPSPGLPVALGLSDSAHVEPPGVLAPLTLSKPPISTHLSKAVMSVGTERGYGMDDKAIPTVLLANYWGSNTCSSLYTRSSCFSNHKNPQSVVTSKSDKTAGTFPSTYPLELRAHHSQFRALFPGLPAAEVPVLVFLASWSSQIEQKADDKFAGNGRIYVTQDNMYFYGRQMGLVIAYAIRLDSISEVTAGPGKEFDYVFLHLSAAGRSGYTRISIKTYLEDLDLLHGRLNLLVDDLQAEEPMEVGEIITALYRLDGMDKKSPSTDRWEEVSLAQRPTRKLQVPNNPVVFEPEDMQEKVAERHFEISAKACFHVLFGDNSFIFPKLYYERRAQHITQGPWTLVDQGKMKREFHFKAEAVDILGRSKIAAVTDFQTIEVFSEHMAYVVSHVKTPWHLPHSQYFNLVAKVAITHLAKSKCKLAVFTKVDWSKAPALSKNMVEKQALADAGRDAEALADAATDQVRKLGPHSRTKRAIQVYGHVGHENQEIIFSPEDTDATRKQAIKPRTLTAMAFETARSFMESVASSLVMWAFAAVRKLFKVATAHRAILALLAASMVLNLMFTSKDVSQWWRERNASRFMKRIGVGPNVMMSKAVYLYDLEEFGGSTNFSQGGGMW